MDVNEIMRIARYYGIGDIRSENIPEPELSGGEALLEVKAVGVCPTDVKAFYTGSSSIRTPIVLGHEVSGVIRKTRTDHLKEGDRVNVAADCPCLSCEICRRGLVNMCPNMESLGVNVDGGYAEFMRIPSGFISRGLVYPLNENVGFIEGALIEPVAVSVHCLGLADYRGVENAVVIGDGPNALIHLQLLKKLKGVSHVTVLGLSEERLNVALKLGADAAVNIADNTDSFSRMRKEQTDLVDITIGNKEAMKEARELLGKGTQLLIFGGSLEDTQLPITMNNVHYMQLRVTGSTGTNLENYRIAADLVNTGRIDLLSLVTRQFKLEELVQAFDYSKRMSGLKSVIEPHSH
jgi:L-iditol 2-dehydrogenase